MNKEKEIRKMLGKEYHLNVEDVPFEKTKWRLYRKYENGDPIYWSKDNEAIMTDETHTEEELYEYAKKHKRVDGEKLTRVIRLIILYSFLILAVINAIFWQNKTLSTFIISCDLILLIWSFVDFYIFNQNFKIDMMEILENHERFKKKLKEVEEDEMKRIYNMLKEFHYEKNGVEETINFLTYVIEELKGKLKIEGEQKNVKKRGRKKKEETKKDA